MCEFAMPQACLTAIHLRRAEAADASAVQACVCAAFEMYRQRIGKAPAPMLYDYPSLIAQRQVWLAERDGQLSGALILLEEDGQFVLDTVASTPQARGTGVGRALLQLAEEQAGSAGYRSIQLYTHITMTENQQLYPRLGYVEYQRAEQDGYSRIFYRKQLL
jgi:GNAT superfamily N-acetyltransferase